MPPVDRLGTTLGQIARMIQGGCFGERAVLFLEPWSTSFKMAGALLEIGRAQSTRAHLNRKGVRFHVLGFGPQHGINSARVPFQATQNGGTLEN